MLCGREQVRIVFNDETTQESIDILVGRIQESLVDYGITAVVFSEEVEADDEA